MLWQLRLLMCVFIVAHCRLCKYLLVKPGSLQAVETVQKKYTYTKMSSSQAARDGYYPCPFSKQKIYGCPLWCYRFSKELEIIPKFKRIQLNERLQNSTCEKTWCETSSKLAFGTKSSLLEAVHLSGLYSKTGICKTSLANQGLVHNWYECIVL